MGRLPSTAPFFRICVAETFLFTISSLDLYLCGCKVEKNQDNPSPPVLSISCAPPSTLTQIHAASKAQALVLCLTWYLLPSTRTNKDDTPRLWPSGAPHRPACPAGGKIPLPPPPCTSQPQDSADPTSSDPLCHQAVAKDGDQALLTERNEGLKGNKLLLLSTLSCLVCLQYVSVCVLPSRSAGSVSLLYTRLFGFHSMTPNLQMDGVWTFPPMFSPLHSPSWWFFLWPVCKLCAHTLY